MERRFEFATPFWLLTPLFWLLPGGRVEVTDDVVRVRMSWGFRGDLQRSAITRVRRDSRRPINRGAHGWAGRWLVNTTGTGLVTLELEPRQRCWSLGIPLRVRALTLSLADPDGFLAEVQR